MCLFFSCRKWHLRRRWGSAFDIIFIFQKSPRMQILFSCSHTSLKSREALRSVYTCQFSTPFPPLSAFCLISPSPCPRWLWVGGQLTSCNRYQRIKSSLKKTCILVTFLVGLFIFQSSTKEDDYKMTVKCPLLSWRDFTEEDVRWQLNPLPPLKCRHPLWMPTL